jgi:tetratricopeptide (TPR) repeat protein
MSSLETRRKFFSPKVNRLCRGRKIAYQMPMSRPRLTALFLALVTLAAYLPVTRYNFITYDDDAYVTANPVVQDGLTPEGLKWAFTTGHASNWHPLTWISHMTDCALFGLNPGAHHFVNILFHAANAALLFILLLRLTGQMWPAAFVAALFAWHPLHVESVAWVAERKDVLSTFFALLTLLSYAKYVQAKSRRSYWFALFFFALGLMSKPMLVTLPFVMLLLDYWPLYRMGKAEGGRRNLSGLLVEKTPFFTLAVASCVITFLVQHSGHAVATLEDVPAGFRLENAVVATAWYLQKLVWPGPLAVIYPLAPIPPVVFAVSAAILIGISVAVWRARLRNRCWLVGWLWFLGTLVPVIGLVQVGSAAMADRYTYIPSIGIFMAVVFGLPELAGKIAWAKKGLPWAAALVLAGCLGAMEWQLHYWRDSETLFRHTLAVTRNNDKAHLDLAVALDQQDRFAEALAEYHEAVRIAPDRYQLYFNMGCALGRLGRHAEALAEFRKAIQFDPHVALWHAAAGGELVTLGYDDEALKEFAVAARLKPDYARPHLETAKFFFQQGRDAEAVVALLAAVQAEPESFQTLATAAHYLAANEHAAARDGQSALTLARKADELSAHGQPLVLDTLGMAYAETGDFTNAAACAQAALALAEAAKLADTVAIRQRLELYKNQQPWRQSFVATNRPVKD